MLSLPVLLGPRSVIAGQGRRDLCCWRVGEKMEKHQLNTPRAAEKGARQRALLSAGATPALPRHQPAWHHNTVADHVPPGHCSCQGHLQLLSQPPGQLCLPVSCGPPEPVPRSTSGDTSVSFGVTRLWGAGVQLEAPQNPDAARWADVVCGAVSCRAAWLRGSDRTPHVCLLLHPCQGLVHVFVMARDD